jgi:hypothetical protein
MNESLPLPLPLPLSPLLSNDVRASASKDLPGSSIDEVLDVPSASSNGSSSRWLPL